MKFSYVFTTAAFLFFTICSILMNANSQAADIVMKVNLLTFTMLLSVIGIVLAILLEVVYMSKKILREHIKE